MAEEAKPLNTDAGYSDLLSFKSDIAQVVSLILLFAESPGSLAELGAFAALQTVAPKLLAVIDDNYYERSSFIRNGPVKFLEANHGEEWVHVLDKLELGIPEDNTLSTLNSIKFLASITPAIDKRLRMLPDWTKCQIRQDGHVILLITGLCQEFGALILKEIREYLDYFKANTSRLQNFIYCAELLGWITKVRKGNNIYYVATQGDSALDYSFNPASTVRDKVRWRSDIRSFWRKEDGPRFSAITKIMAGAISP